MKYNLLNHKGLLALCDQGVLSGGNLIFTLILARYLGPAGFGVFASFQLGLYLLVSLLNALIVQPFQVSYFRVADQASYISYSYWGQLLLVSLVIGIVGVLHLFDFVSPLLGRSPGVGELLFAVCFLMHDYSRKLLLATGAVKKVLAIDMITAFLLVFIPVVLLFAGTDSFLNDLAYFGLAYLPACILGTFFIQPLSGNRSEWPVFFRMHVQQGKWLVFTAITQWCAGNLFVVASGVFLGIEALGALRLVQSIFGILNIVLQSYENHVLPEATRLYMNSIPAAKKYLRNTSLYVIILFGVVFFLLFVFADEIMRAAGGGRYIEYAYLIKWMGILYACITIGYPIRIAIRMLLLNQHFFNGYVLSLGFGLLSFNYLLSNWNLNGAIAGLILSQLIVLAYWNYILNLKKFSLWKSYI